MIITSTVAGWILVMAGGTGYGNRLEAPTIWPTEEICHQVGKSYKRVWKAARDGNPVSPTSKESDLLAYECIPLQPKGK